MNVDVSPDGTQVVFDLLGDIYIMPIAGSGTRRPRALTSGPAFDMQPRFSPDGKRIAFASDRDGLWNIWTMDLGGQGREADLAREALVRQQPGVVAGRRIHLRAAALRQGALARRRRDLDVSRAGPSDGLQVTERNGWQKDAGEPDVSPDGRYALLQQGRHARADLRVQQGSERHDLRDHPPRSHDRPRAARRQRAGRLGRRRRSRPTASRSPTSAACACRACSTSAISSPAAIGSSSATSTRICRRRGRSTASTRSTRGRPTASRS